MPWILCVLLLVPAHGLVSGALPTADLKLKWPCSQWKESQRFCKRSAGSCVGKSFLFQHCPEHTLQLEERKMTQMFDWNGDGHLDLLLSSKTHFEFFWGTAGGGLAKVADRFNPFSFLNDLVLDMYTCPHANDWDGDLDLDLLVCSRLGSSGSNYSEFRLDFWERDPGGLGLKMSRILSDFGIRLENEDSFLACCPQLIDWDGDADLDLIVGLQGMHENKFFFLEGLGDLVFAPHNDSESPFRMIPKISGGLSMPQAIDWDRDGRVDLVIHTGTGSKLFLQGSSGRIWPVPEEPSPFEWLYLLDRAYLVDLDGNGDLDLVICDQRNQLKFWRQVPAPYLQAHVGEMNPFRNVQVGPSPFCVVDWDRDGRLDLVSIQSNSIVLWRASTVGFERRLLGKVDQDLTAISVQAVAWADDWAFIVTDKLNSTDVLRPQYLAVRFLLDQGNSSFTVSTIILQPEVARRRCAAVDADGDGHLDFYCAEDALLSFYRGNGTGYERISETWSFPSTSPCSLQLVDSEPGSYVSLAAQCTPPGAGYSMFYASGPAEKVIYNWSYFPGWDSRNMLRNLYAVDWDGDGMLEAFSVPIFSNGLTLYSQGHCVGACNGGICDGGRCVCSMSRALDDCSACAAEHALTSLGSCQACPGFGSWPGTCSRRGSCGDDRRAIEEARATKASNATVSLRRGNSKCECSPHFSGEDCSVGQCPPGMELNTLLKRCVACAVGMYKPDVGNQPCGSCEAGRFADTAGSERCQACRPGVVKYTSASGQAHCHLEALSGVMALLATLSQILLAVLLANMLGSRIPIQDMCFKAGQGVVVTTATIHMVRPRAHVTVHLEGTGRPWLDTKPTSSVSLKAVVLDPCSLLLLDQEGNTLPEGSSTSCGWLRLPPDQAIRFSGFQFCPSWVLAAGCFASFVAMSVRSHLHSGIVLLLLLLGSLCFYLARIHRMSWTARNTLLRKCLRKFRQQLRQKQPEPRPTARGPERAICLGQLRELLDGFQGLIQDRDMYYVCHNIVMPLTEEVQLSYAEVAGSHRAEYFVSHYWGTPFADYVNSMRKHAAATGADQLGQWQIAYWICTFALNQRDLDAEMGSGFGWQYSSFYLALTSGIKGTATILDADVKALQRSWCLFELFHSFKLSARTPGFRLLFCAESGVLNYGSCSVDVAMAISEKLMTLRLEDAQANVPADKKTIDELISQEPGGFRAVNSSLKKRISEVLRATEAHLKLELGRLSAGLDQSTTRVSL